MTATLDLDMTRLLCRYAIDPAVGSLEILPPEDAPEECGVPGSQGDTGGGGTGDATETSDERGGESLVPLPADAAEAVPDSTDDGVLGVPAVPGGAP